MANTLTSKEKVVVLSKEVGVGGVGGQSWSKGTVAWLSHVSRAGVEGTGDSSGCRGGYSPSNFSVRPEHGREGQQAPQRGSWQGFTVMGVFKVFWERSGRAEEPRGSGTHE